MKAIGHHGPLVVLNAAVLAGVAAWAFSLWPGAGLSVGAEGASPTAIAPLPNHKPTTHQSLVQRPLLSPTRRPVAAKVQPAAQEAAVVATPAPTLLGIAGVESRLGALLMDSSGRRSHLVRPGDTFGGWTVVAVGSRVVRIRNGAAVTDLHLRRSAKSPAPSDAATLGR